jgi:predicted HTH domain antitoxin
VTYSERTYTVAQLAKLAGIGRNQTYEAVRKKEVPSISFGKAAELARAHGHGSFRGLLLTRSTRAETYRV